MYTEYNSLLVFNGSMRWSLQPILVVKHLQEGRFTCAVTRFALFSVIYIVPNHNKASQTPVGKIPGDETEHQPSSSTDFAPLCSYQKPTKLSLVSGADIFSVGPVLTTQHCADQSSEVV